jgi:aspartate/methionine/tyrosine aminotransferase
MNLFILFCSSSSAHGRPFCNVRSVVLFFPNNPCGTLLTAEEARSLADFLHRRLEEHPEADFSVRLDEVYLGLTHSMEEHHSVISYASPRLLKNIFLVLSASKGLGAMPGERAGSEQGRYTGGGSQERNESGSTRLCSPVYLARFCLFLALSVLLSFLVCFDDDVNLELVKVQSALTANASITAQIGLQASLQHIIDHPDVLQRAYQYYHERTSYCVQRLNAMAQK